MLDRERTSSGHYGIGIPNSRRCQFTERVAYRKVARKMREVNHKIYASFFSDYKIIATKFCIELINTGK
jgi:hypothetical protein